MFSRNADPRREWVHDPDMHGSARWADEAHLAERGYGPYGRHLLGFLPAAERGEGTIPVTYDGFRHEVVVSPTRGGKGVSGAVPRLLDHHGGAVVLDVKDGELAQITARYREEVLGQNVCLIDPYDVVSSRLGRKPARINPLLNVDLDGDEPFDEAMLIADACVIPETHGESHWSGEAAALIAGLILRESEIGGTLASVRDALNRDADSFATYVEGMMSSPYKLVRAAAGRISNKVDRELSSVISTAHRNTHFLESAKLAASLSASDIDLSTIGSNTTIYIVLPARRIRAAKRWLRLLTAMLINVITALPEKPHDSVMILLEEMAALERMAIIEQSFGLMAGYGIQLVAVIQDFTQLRDLYRDRWETFIANAASVQCFGTNDFFTARYLSDLSGRTSAERVSYESSQIRASLVGDPEFRAQGDFNYGRPLITPDELMSLHPCVQFIKLAAAKPVMGYRPAYFLDQRYRDRRGQPLYDIHPHHADWPVPKAINFLQPGLYLGAELSKHLKVG